MEGADNDNTETYVTLFAATKNVLLYLESKKRNETVCGDKQTDAGTESAQDEAANAKERYVEKRLHELAAFERRVSGEDRASGKRRKGI